MLKIKRYIIEKLKIDNETKTVEYQYFPKSKAELIKIISSLIKERGADADPNDIDTSEIKDMSYLFNMDSSDYRCNFKDIGKIDISGWNTSNVVNMAYLFYKWEDFNCDLKGWDLSNVTNAESMFEGCKKFNCNISNWDTSNLKNMKSMFKNCENFNSDISKWNTSNVETLQTTFFNCKRFNSDLNDWNTSKVSNMYGTFYKCENFNSDLSKWDVSNVSDMYGMFSGCKKFNGNGLENWKPKHDGYSRVKTEYMFDGTLVTKKRRPSWYKK